MGLPQSQLSSFPKKAISVWLWTYYGPHYHHHHMAAPFSERGPRRPGFILALPRAGRVLRARQLRPARHSCCLPDQVMVPILPSWTMCSRLWVVTGPWPHSALPGPGPYTTLPRSLTFRNGRCAGPGRRASASVGWPVAPLEGQQSVSPQLSPFTETWGCPSLCPSARNTCPFFLSQVLGDGASVTSLALITSGRPHPLPLPVATALSPVALQWGLHWPPASSLVSF